MKEYVFIYFLFLMVPAIQAQLSVGASTADPSAQLDVTAADKGILIPRVALTGTSDTTTIVNGNETSLLVYNTATAGDIAPGYHYWDGTKWQRLANTDYVTDAVTDYESNTVLSLNSASGALQYTNEQNNNPTVDLTDIEPWYGSDNNAGATSNTEDIYSRGQVGIGTTNPSSSLDVVGSLQYQDGNQADGRVLTSDANGNASWRDAISNGSGSGTITGQVVNATGNSNYVMPEDGYLFRISARSTFDLGDPGGANTNRFVVITKTPYGIVDNSSVTYKSGTQNKILDAFTGGIRNSVSYSNQSVRAYSDGTYWILVVN